MESFEDFKKKYEFEKYEQTSCLIYEMYIRAENIKKEDLNIDTSFNYFSDAPRIKDIYLNYSNSNMVTLQNIIYNIYPELYIDAIIWITQYHVHQQLISINDNLSHESIKNILKEQKEIIDFFSNILSKINPHISRLFYNDEFFEMENVHKLISFRDIIDNIENNLDVNEDKKNFFSSEVETEINKLFEKMPKTSTYIQYKNLAENIYKILEERTDYKDIEKNKSYLKIISKSIHNIIGYLLDLQQELKISLNDDIESFEIEISGFHRNIQNHLNIFSYPLNYLENEYLNKEEKHFIPQLIESPYDNSYIRITKKYVQDLIKNYLLNFRITPNFKRPIFELNKISPLTTLHNINLSLPIEELTSYMQNLKDSHNKALNIEEKTKYEIIHHKETINVEKYLTDLETAVKILYIYDYPLSKKKIEKDEIKIWTKLKISRNTYYLFKKIGTTYIDEKKYLELFNSKKIKKREDFNYILL